MEDKGVDFSKPPPESEPPTANRSIVQSLLSRQSGVKSKSGTVPTELQWAAEDKMIMRNHEEYVSFRLKLNEIINRQQILVLYFRMWRLLTFTATKYKHTHPKN